MARHGRGTLARALPPLFVGAASASGCASVDVCRRELQLAKDSRVHAEAMTTLILSRTQADAEAMVNAQLVARGKRADVRRMKAIEVQEASRVESLRVELEKQVGQARSAEAAVAVAASRAEAASAAAAEVSKMKAECAEDPLDCFAALLLARVLDMVAWLRALPYQVTMSVIDFAFGLLLVLLPVRAQALTCSGLVLTGSATLVGCAAADLLEALPVDYQNGLSAWRFAVQAGAGISMTCFVWLGSDGLRLVLGAILGWVWALGWTALVGNLGVVWSLGGIVACQSMCAVLGLLVASRRRWGVQALAISMLGSLLISGAVCTLLAAATTTGSFAPSFVDVVVELLDRSDGSDKLVGSQSVARDWRRPGHVLWILIAAPGLLFLARSGGDVADCDSCKAEAIFEFTHGTKLNEKQDGTPTTASIVAALSACSESHDVIGLLAQMAQTLTTLRQSLPLPAAFESPSLLPVEPLMSTPQGRVRLRVDPRVSATSVNADEATESWG